MKQIPVIIGSLIIIVGVGGFFVYSQFFADEEVKKTEEHNTNVVLDVEENSTSTPGYSIEVLSKDEDILPSLSRSVQFSANIPEDVREIIKTKVVTAQENLREDPNSGADWLELGLLYHAANDYEGSREVWEFLTKVLPNDTVAFDNLGKLYHYDLKDYPKSEEYFRKSMSIDPNSLTPYLELHNLYRYSYKTETTAAVDILEDAMAAFPENVRLYFSLGAYYSATGNTEKARTTFTEGLNKARDEGDVALIKEFGVELERLN
ncbi:MAG: tetratricopeptide repeat protein [Patescibacteria group bacterium UBA2163]